MLVIIIKSQDRLERVRMGLSRANESTQYLIMFPSPQGVVDRHHAHTKATTAANYRHHNLFFDKSKVNHQKMVFTLEARKLIVERMDKQFQSDLDARRRSNEVRKKATGHLLWGLTENLNMYFKMCTQAWHYCKRASARTTMWFLIWRQILLQIARD